MGRKKGQSGRNGRDSNGQRRGVKLFGGELAIPGNIIVRQLGNKFYPGVNVGQGKEYTLFAKAGGKVTFRTGRNRQFIDVLPE